MQIEIIRLERIIANVFNNRMTSAFNTDTGRFDKIRSAPIERLCAIGE
jgi:hypothetical protein